jgi:hypothetical protein
MEQIPARLLAEINAIREKIGSDEEKVETKHKRMETKIGAEIKTIREKMNVNREKTDGG